MTSETVLTLWAARGLIAAVAVGVLAYIGFVRFFRWRDRRRK